MFFGISINNPPHTMINTALIKPLICLDLILVLDSNPYKQESPLPAINGDLPDNLIKALIIEFFPDSTNSHLLGLFTE